jgi:hypothetical protein
MKTISIKQPWAWAVFHAGLNIISRRKKTNFRGRLLIHASQNIDHNAYRAIKNISGITPPAASALPRGAIIGHVDVHTCVRRSKSPWFFGPFGLKIKNPVPLRAFRYRGQIGFFSAYHPDAAENITPNSGAPCPASSAPCTSFDPPNKCRKYGRVWYIPGFDKCPWILRDGTPRTPSFEVSRTQSITEQVRGWR